MEKKEKKNIIVKEPAQISNRGDFAVFITGGKQYKVAVGDILKIEKIIGEYKAGDKVSFDQVLLTEKNSETVVGTPYIPEAKIQSEIVEIGRNAKIDVIHYKQKSRYFKKYGHRQPFFKVRIEKI